MIRHLACLLTLSCFAPLAAAAGDNGSQAQHQAPAQTFEVTPEVAYIDATAKYAQPSAATKNESTGTREGIAAEYGINDMISLGLRLNYESVTTKYSPSSASPSRTTKGMVDPDFFVNGRYDTGNGGSLRFGTELSINLQKATIDANHNQNAASGGTTLTPFIGYEMVSGNSVFGARLSYELYKGDRSVTLSYSNQSDLNATIKNGETLKLSGFYEYRMPSLVIGGLVQLATQKNSDLSANGQSVTESDANTELNVAVYLPVLLTDNVTLLPQIQYATETAFDKRFSSIDQFAVQLAARFAF